MRYKFKLLYFHYFLRIYYQPFICYYKSLEDTSFNSNRSLRIRSFILTRLLGDRHTWWSILSPKSDYLRIAKQTKQNHISIIGDDGRLKTSERHTNIYTHTSENKPSCITTYIAAYIFISSKCYYSPLIYNGLFLFHVVPHSCNHFDSFNCISAHILRYLKLFYIML